VLKNGSSEEKNNIVCMWFKISEIKSVIALLLGLFLIFFKLKHLEKNKAFSFLCTHPGKF
jgi:hypothetical protein